MLAGNALRHQMILPEQQALFDYWRSLTVGGELPRRSDLNPVKLQPYLPFLSIAVPEGEGDGIDFRFRLAGTGFWDIYNQEISGKRLSELPTGSRRDYWKKVLSRVVEQAKPSAGAGPFGVSGKTHMAQFWLRLPLYDEESNRIIILGFDKFVEKSMLSRQSSVPQLISA